MRPAKDPMEKWGRERKEAFKEAALSLKTGEYYKYCELCEILNQPKKYGSSKTYQIREWGEVINYKKKGIWFLVYGLQGENKIDSL